MKWSYLEFQIHANLRIEVKRKHLVLLHSSK